MIESGPQSMVSDIHSALQSYGYGSETQVPLAGAYGWISVSNTGEPCSGDG